MSIRLKENLWSLSDKEKETLRLMVRGHDAKSIARNLGLSVHTINERLRDARRKMTVSSSREAARLLLDAEGGDHGPPNPEYPVDARIGEDAGTPRADREAALTRGVGPAHRRPWIIIGGLLMTFALGLLVFAALPQAASVSPVPTATHETPDAAVVESARRFLVLIDQARWDESYRATGAAFQKLNTSQVWAATSEQVRVPLGAVISRAFISQQNLPAPPAGYEVVKFRTSFANKADVVETVTLERQNGNWRVVGIAIG